MLERENANQDILLKNMLIIQMNVDESDIYLFQDEEVLNSTLDIANLIKQFNLIRQRNYFQDVVDIQ